MSLCLARVSGAVALSCYLPCRDHVESNKSEANAAIKILQCHGEEDAVVAFSWGDSTREQLEAWDYNVSFKVRAPRRSHRRFWRSLDLCGLHNLTLLLLTRFTRPSPGLELRRDGPQLVQRGNLRHPRLS